MVAYSTATVSRIRAPSIARVTSPSRMGGAGFSLNARSYSRSRMAPSWSIWSARSGSSWRSRSAVVGGRFFGRAAIADLPIGGASLERVNDPADLEDDRSEVHAGRHDRGGVEQVDDLVDDLTEPRILGLQPGLVAGGWLWAASGAGHVGGHQRTSPVTLS